VILGPGCRRDVKSLFSKNFRWFSGRTQHGRSVLNRTVSRDLSTQSLRIFKRAASHRNFHHSNWFRRISTECMVTFPNGIRKMWKRYFRRNRSRLPLLLEACSSQYISMHRCSEGLHRYSRLKRTLYANRIFTREVAGFWRVLRILDAAACVSFPEVHSLKEFIC
jgi:hypothetical protein